MMQKKELSSERKFLINPFPLALYLYDMKHIFLFIFLCISSLAIAQYDYIPVFKGQQGDILLSSMVSEYKPVVVLSYSDARNELYTSIDNNNGDVSGIYTDHSVFLPANEANPIQFLLMNNSVDGINCEHTYPQSKGAGNGNARSDMHHLYPARAQVNSSRGSKPFGENIDSDTDTWFYLNQSQSSIPNASTRDNFSESDILAFEPRESVKGNIARGMMYFYTMYKAEADNADPDYFPSQIETLCEWHFTDPVDQAEWERTMKIGAIQGNNPNPYVLDCSVASRTFCSQISDACAELVPSSEIEFTPSFKIYPNPSIDQINIEVDQKSKVSSLKMISIYGQVVYQTSTFNNSKISIDHKLPAGNYICQINIDGDIYNRLFVIVK